MIVRQFEIGGLVVQLEVLGEHWLCHVDGTTTWRCPHGQDQEVPVSIHKRLPHQKLSKMMMRVVESAIRGDVSSAAWLANDAATLVLTSGKLVDKCPYSGAAL